MRMNIRSAAFVVFVFALLCVVLYYCIVSCKEHSPYKLTVVEMEEGKYGYEITKGEQTIIFQPFIPGLSHQRAFTRAVDAHRVGSLVKERLEKDEHFSISPDDLKRLKLLDDE